MSDRTTIHGLDPRRWHAMDLMNQLGNIGSEVGRALRARAAGRNDRMWAAIDRMLELFELTLADPRLQGRRKEICRAREVALDHLVGDDLYGSSDEDLERYFTHYGIAARLGTSVRAAR
jgi:hypothetical protein